MSLQEAFKDLCDPAWWKQTMDKHEAARQAMIDKAGTCPKCGKNNHTPWVLGCIRRSYCLTEGCGTTLEYPPYDALQRAGLN